MTEIEEGLRFRNAKGYLKNLTVVLIVSTRNQNIFVLIFFSLIGEYFFPDIFHCLIKCLSKSIFDFGNGMRQLEMFFVYISKLSSRLTL